MVGDVAGARMLALTAARGMLAALATSAGCAGPAGPASPGALREMPEYPPAADKPGGASRAVAPVASGGARGPVAVRQRSPNCCKGQNACKGQGSCKTDKHACKGQNDCKGLGGCKPAVCP